MLYSKVDEEIKFKFKNLVFEMFLFVSFFFNMKPNYLSFFDKSLLMITELSNPAFFKI